MIFSIAPRVEEYLELALHFWIDSRLGRKVQVEGGLNHGKVVAECFEPLQIIQDILEIRGNLSSYNPACDGSHTRVGPSKY